jgi:hypothetical protein
VKRAVKVHDALYGKSTKDPIEIKTKIIILKTWVLPMKAEKTGRRSGKDRKVLSLTTNNQSSNRKVNRFISDFYLQEVRTPFFI